MNRKDCSILVTLSEEKSVTKAAEKLYISQPALTYRLLQMEKNFDTQIFIREKSGLTPTPRGELIIKYAYKNLRILKETLESIELIGEEVSGTIKLGVASTYGQYILPDLLNQFAEKYPKVNFEITTGLSSVIFDMFTRGVVHIAILRGEYHWEEKQDLLAAESICVVSRGSIPMDELPNFPRIEYKMDGYLKNIIDSWWNNKFSKKGAVSMNVDSLETAKELVRTGFGYTILPGICLMREKELIIQPIKNSDGESIERLTRSFCRQRTLDFKAVKEFYNFLQLNSGLK